jgi:hypothetical protein
MKIILDTNKKVGILVKENGNNVKEISRYSFKKLITDDFTIEELQKDVDGFNKTLSHQEDIDVIKKLNDYLKIHNFD